MIKVKNIKLSGFRGILYPQDLNLIDGGSNPRSFVLYGLNSSGKTSFVDGFEWFLSSSSEIEWLKREDAGQKAYPHQEAKEGESYVEISFDNDAKKLITLTKTFDKSRITKPILSSEQDFEAIYKSFIIKPYLRYLEVIDFVYNSTGAKKYQILASWMGFEKELAFQEKLALRIIPEIRANEEQYLGEIQQIESTLKKLTGNDSIAEIDIINCCVNIMSSYGKYSFSIISELKTHLGDMEKLKTSSLVAQKLSRLSKTETFLKSASFDSNLVSKCTSLKKKVDSFKEKKEIIQKVDIIDLYTQALDILNKECEEKVKCPVCGIEWQREKLTSHIKSELELLNSVNEAKAEIEEEIRALKVSLRQEQNNVGQIIDNYMEIKAIIPAVSYANIEAYKSKIDSLEVLLGENVLDRTVEDFVIQDDVNNVDEEKERIKEVAINEKSKIEPSEEEIKLNEDIEKIKKISDSWDSLYNVKKEADFFKIEVEKFILICSELSKFVEQGITKKFNDISDLIRKYFGILRKDKEIKNIELVLNLEKGRATGRSAEIQLSYYNITTKPAYKVLSESLLNSLGLAVYFTCLKQFNSQTKFIVLDDIMNSLDMGHRDTLLDLIEAEFHDYQIILFTHDLYWFQKIQRRFPQWITKKIKGWDYMTGPKIDYAKTTVEEIEELLEDSTKIEQAGALFTRYLEGILNELCEDLYAETRHRFTQNDSPSLEELFIALYKRLKNKLGKDHSVVRKVFNAKAYEPLLRNFTTHPRENYPTSISPDEVKRAIEEWQKINGELWCSSCNEYVQYIKSKDAIECKCGSIKLSKQLNGEAIETKL